MKTLTVKIVLCGAYLLAVELVWNSSLFSGFVVLTAKILLLYCGLIVVAHFCTTLELCWRRWLARQRTAWQRYSTPGTRALETEGPFSTQG